MSNTKVTGFESSLIESWTGWDEMETMIVAFYDSKLKYEIDGVDIDNTYYIEFHLDKLQVLIYDDEGDVIKTLNMKITFE